MRLILFDIDGTLLECGPQVRPILTDILVEVYGRIGNIDRYDLSGRTDPRIALDLMTEAGLTEEEILPRLHEVRTKYAARLERELDGKYMRLLPGVSAA